LKIQLSIAQLTLLKEALPFWCERYAYACILSSNGISSACNYDTYDLIAGIADANTITYIDSKAMDVNPEWKLGYITYEYNHTQHGIPQLKESTTGFTGCFFFVPRILLIIKKGSNEIEIVGADETILDVIIHSKSNITIRREISLTARVAKEEYISNVEKIKEQITDGDFYELNYCMEFYVEDTFMNAPQVFLNLDAISPTPFASYIKHQNKYLLCASPERFLKREGDKIIAQPIKGTTHRGADIKEDDALKIKLEQSEKEQAENIMIVDLMRNDLARCAERASVRAEELLTIYSFATVHQLISTVTATLKSDISFHDILNNTFPMGSMTGAPKREVIHAIDKYEHTARGIFSGSVGYISPEKDFDFNVVIRSIIYNAERNYISCHVGSAITYDADAASEYEECLLKAKTMFKALDTEKIIF
jgi:para-aminobenzoate synthetase component 1